jgi:hypothetical protein
MIGYFKCVDCGYGKLVPVSDSKVLEPEKCEREECPGTMQIIHSRCQFYDKQIIRIQETPDAVPDGQTPHTVSLVAYDELIDCCKPGDRYDSLFSHLKYTYTVTLLLSLDYIMMTCVSLKTLVCKTCEIQEI